MTSQPGASVAYRLFGTFRLVLAILVLLQHFLANLAPLPLPSFLDGNEIGSVAVLVFFALSGFVIVEAAVRFYAGRPGAFLTNRSLRIIPHFLLAVVLLIAIEYLFTRLGTLRIERTGHLPGPEAFTARNVLLNIVGFLPLADRKVSWNFLSIAWAIRVEMAFYFVVAACLFAVMLASRACIRLRIGTVLLSATIALIPVTLLAQFGKAPSMFQFLPYFVFGAALYFAVANRSRMAGLVTVAALAGICAHFLSLPVEEANYTRAVRAEFFELILLLVAMSLLATLRAGKLEVMDRALGELTYPLYLQHANVMIVALSLTAGYSNTTFAVAIVASLLVALAANRIVDPFVDLARDKVRGRAVRTPSAERPSPDQAHKPPFSSRPAV
jgi:peptidoglycan/LPS O-acetylase OafA/YrhL